MSNLADDEARRKTLSALSDADLTTLLDWLTQEPIVHGYPDSDAMAVLVREVQGERRKAK